MKVTIWLIALIVAGEVWDKGYPTAAWGIAITATLEMLAQSRVWGGWIGWLRWWRDEA